MFENLNEFYDYLENDRSLTPNYNISNKLFSLIEKTKDELEKKNLLYEQYCTDLSFKNGRLIPKFSTNENSYPDLTLFDDNLNYIKSRVYSEEFINPRNKAKYSHIIWESPEKHIDFAKISIDNYYIFLKSISFLEDDHLSNKGFSIIYQNLFVLGESINYRQKEILDFLIDHLKKDKLNGYQKYHLMMFVLKDAKKVTKEVKTKFFEYSNNVIENNSYPEFIQEYLNLLITLCLKKDISAKTYQNQLGDFYIKESIRHTESFVVHDYYLNALKQYQKAGNLQKLEEVSVLIEKAKDNLNFKSINTEHTTPELQRWYENLKTITANLIENGESEDIYEHLIFYQIFPKADILGQKIKSATMDLVSTMSFDINRNVSDSKDIGINTYFVHLLNFSLQHLWLIFTKGLHNQKISYDTLKNYFQNNSWFGEDVIFVNEDGDEEVFNWLDLIMPAFDSYFVQSEIDIKENQNSKIGYVLAIDSLVLKFEGVLRAFSKNIGAQTIEVNENGTQERISFEKLLKNDKLNKIVPEDDIALFKFIFTSEGMNLRNNIAHCFYKPKNYAASIMWLLTCVFLKLGNFNKKEQ